MGECFDCADGTQAIVKLQDVPLCFPHFEERLAAIGAAMRRFRQKPS